MAIEIKLSKDEFAEMLAENPKLADEYVKDEKADGYTLQAAVGYESPEDIQGLKSALKKERDFNKKLAGESEGHTKRELDRFMGELETLRSENETLKGVPAQFEALQQQFASLTDTLGKERSQRAIVEAVQAGRGNIALTEYLQRRVKTDPATGRPGAIDPETGEALLDAEGKPLTVVAYVKHLRAQATTAEHAELGALFYGARSSGGGMLPGGGGAGGGTVPANMKRGTMTPRQKVDFIKERGDAEYQKLPL